MHDRVVKMRGAIYYGGDKNLADVKRMLDDGVDPNFQIEGGMTVLMTAAHEGAIETVKLLLKYGADPSIQDDIHKTALDYARSEGHRDVVKLLGGDDKSATVPKRVAPAPSPAAKSAAAPAQTDASNHCRIMYGKTYKLCGTSDYSCKAKAAQDYSKCKKTGTWF